MADKKKMSLEDILAACRKADAGEDSPAVPAASGSVAETESDTSPAKASLTAADSSDTDSSDTDSSDSGASTPKAGGPMSVADILAAARQADGGSGAGPGAGAAAPTGARAPAAGKKPAAAAGKKAGDMDIADILAAARGATAKPAAAAPKAAKPAAAAVAKTTPAAPAAKKAAGPVDTSSILAAARKGDKPGPMSKSAAAAAGQTKATAPKRMAPPMPEKPAYAQPKALAAPSDRRSFFSIFLGSFLALGFTTFSITGLLWTLGLARFMFPNILIEPPNQFKVGFPSDFAPGAVETKFIAQFGVWVVNAEYNWPSSRLWL
jgi:cytochrome b6-f complex iron-sulfur subunit